MCGRRKRLGRINRLSGGPIVSRASKPMGSRCRCQVLGVSGFLPGEKIFADARWPPGHGRVGWVEEERLDIIKALHCPGALAKAIGQEAAGNPAKVSLNVSPGKVLASSGRRLSAAGSISARIFALLHAQACGHRAGHEIRLFSGLNGPLPGNADRMGLARVCDGDRSVQHPAHLLAHCFLMAFHILKTIA